MKILALETATEQSSCALWIDGQLISRCTSPVQGKHPQSSEWLLPNIRDLLGESGYSLYALDAIAFGAGPGAFTGLRMACALAQGLAEGAGLPVVGVPSLAGMAWQVGQAQFVSNKPQPFESIWVLLDARMGEVYAAQYQWVDQAPLLVGEIVVEAPDRLEVPTGSFALCGNGALAYPVLLQRGQEAGAVWVPDVQPVASAIAELAVIAVQRGQTTHPADAAPLYVRNNVAKTVAERLAEGGRA